MSLFNAFEKGSLTLDRFESGNSVELLDVLKFYAHDLIGLCQQLSGVCQSPDLEEVRMQLCKEISSRTQRNRAIEILESLGLSVSAISLAKLIQATVKSPPIPIGDFKELLLTLNHTIPNELSTKQLFLLSPEEIGYFNGTRFADPPATWTNFPSSEHEIQEAGKCFALNRNTACVFHAMRAMEPGLYALAKDLGFSIQENWNKALDMIEKEIRSRSKRTHGEIWVITDEPFYTGAAVHFRIVKNAWRNHTAHLRNRYDKEQAQDILNSVVAFMRHLATRLHEIDEERPEHEGNHS
jgi:hypothetical protein